MTKKIIRSITWKKTEEKAIAADNLRKLNKERLLNLSPAEDNVLTYILELHVQYGEPPTYDSVKDHFENQNKAEESFLVEEVSHEDQYSGAAFENLVEEVVEQQTVDILASTCRKALKIANDGLTIKGKTLKGIDDAISILFSEIRTKPPKTDDLIPASLTKSAPKLRSLYEERKKNPQNTYGVLTGYGLIDTSTAGIRKKNLYIHAGFASHLKSTHMFNMIINATVAGWNPLLFTSEMPANDVKLLLVAIHSGNPKFNGIGRPLNAFRLLLGALNPQEENFFDQVMEDLVKNSDHGLIRIVDSGEFSGFGSITQRVTREHEEEEVDIVWIDYLTRLQIDTKYRGMTVTEARNETIMEAKRFAMSFDRGRGLALASPFQVNREGFKKAKENEGKMDKTALAQYNAIEREADIISYIWYGEEEVATSEPKCGLMKSRWGHVPADPISLFIDPDSRRIFDLSAGMTMKQGVAPTRTTTGVEEEVVL